MCNYLWMKKVRLNVRSLGASASEAVARQRMMRNSAADGARAHDNKLRRW
jgi:hypothetical protein